MPKSAFEQTAFIGGEFAALAQGRSDIPQYKQGMSLSLNGHPVEEGAWVKRSGFEMIVPTRGRTFGRLLPFDGSATCSFGLLFTNDNLQFITSTGSLIFDNTVTTITASGMVGSASEITVSPAQAGWANDDQLMISFPDASSTLFPYPIAQESGLRGRLLTILPLAGVVDSTHFYLANDIGVSLGLDPSVPLWVGNELVGAQIMRVKNIATTYSTVQQLQNLRAVQIEYQSVILETSTPPQVVQITTGPVQGPGGADPVFSLGALSMIDGPYLDPLNDTATVSAYTGTITLTMTATTPFVSTDAGRPIRLFSQPAAYNPAHAYSAGDLVTDASGEWWTCIVANTGTQPGQPIVSGGVQQIAWAPAPFAGSWAWGTISTVSSSSVVHVALDATIPGMALQSDNGTTMTTIQLGVYSATTGYPTCGCYHQGRLWLGGAQANRFDTTISNGVEVGVATFSPTDPYGNVLDSSGMSEIFNSRYTNNIQWMTPCPNGVIMGTLNGPFLVSASQQNDPITPTDIQSWMATKDGSAFIEPVSAGMSTIFVQKYGRRVMEYVADAFSQKFSARHLNEWSKHIAASGVAELAYQEETFPCVWARMNNGLLAGCTYRRFSRFVAEPPNIAGWHWHIHGRQRAFTSMCVIPGKAGLLERLFVVTNDVPDAGPGAAPNENYYVEVMQPYFEEDQTAQQGWFVDEAPGPGPGADPAFDCGGGNAFAFQPTGPYAAADTTVPDTTGIFPYDTNPTVGTDLSANLVLRQASFFDGNTCLYSLPPFPSQGSQADEVGMAMSVWIARVDCPLNSGAMLSSPALSFAEATAGTTMVSNLLGGPISAANAPGSMLARSTTGLDTYPNAVAEVGDATLIPGVAGGGDWVNILISWKSNGDGTFNIMAYADETLLSNATNVGGVRNNGDAWPFLTQPGAAKDNGLSVWTIGGTEAAHSTYNFFDVYGSVSTGPLVSGPTLAQIIAQVTSTPAGYHLPSLRQMIKNTLNQAKAQQIIEITRFTGSGGLGNIPTDNPIGGVNGYHGSVAELWIKPTFIDWSVSGNRAKMHWFDSVVSAYKPLSLGHTGGGTSLGTPWIYLSGPPPLWNLNRANGQRLTVAGEIVASELPPPQG